MTPAAAPSTPSLVQDQVLGAIVELANVERAAAEAAALLTQDQAMAAATESIDQVRTFLGSPENILGRPDTKHGEIAEQVEVGIRNARSLLQGEVPTATFDGVGRTAPEDYLIAGDQVQSKFINGARNTLDHVREHMDKYEYFGRDGQSFYHIPKDTHDQIQRVLNGTETELSESTQQTIRDKVAHIESLTGKPFTETVKPAISDYREVQQGAVHDTLDRHEDALQQENETKKDTIRQEHEPSLEDAAKLTAIAAAIGAAVSVGTLMYMKYRSGKNPFAGDFTLDDWKEVGLGGATGAATAGLSAAAIYALTNYSGMAAPFASAFVSAAKGVSTLAKQYHQGEISGAALADLGMLCCTEAAIVGAAAALGQTMIPVPLLGAVIGSMAGRMLSSLLKKELGATSSRLQQQMDQYVSQLDSLLQETYATIQAKFDRLGDLTAAALDTNNNQQLVDASITLAREHGVTESRILKTHADLERYLLD